MPLAFAEDSPSHTRRSPEGKGSGLRRTAYTALKIAVFAPIPDSQRQDHDQREDARSPDTSRRVTKVLKERFKRRKLPRLIASLAHGGRITKVTPRRGTRLFRRHAALQILIDQELKMGVHLLLQFVQQDSAFFPTHVTLSTTIGA